MADTVRFTYRNHLVRLIARSEAAAQRLSDAGSEEERRAVAATVRREAAALSARLDASPLTDETAARVDAGASMPGGYPARAGGAAASGPLAAPQGRGSAGSWAAALRLDELPDQEVAAVEYGNLLACYDAEPAIAEEFFSAPLSTLITLHGHLAAGLVAPDRVGQIRDFEQDVHDGSQGQVVYRTPPPREVPRLLDELVSWLGTGSAGVPALVVAGVVHGRLLEWQPFDAANGRLARCAARVVLRARGLDPDGLAVPERIFAAAPIAYYAEVGASIRRRGDLTAWLERTGEAVAWALEEQADALRGGRPQPPARAAGIVSTMAPGEVVTLPEYAEQAGTDRDTAASDLEALRRAGLLALDPGTQGLRFRRVAS